MEKFFSSTVLTLSFLLGTPLFSEFQQGEDSQDILSHPDNLKEQEFGREPPQNFQLEPADSGLTSAKKNTLKSDNRDSQDTLLYRSNLKEQKFSKEPPENFQLEPADNAIDPDEKKQIQTELTSTKTNTLESENGNLQDTLLYRSNLKEQEFSREPLRDFQLESETSTVSDVEQTADISSAKKITLLSSANNGELKGIVLVGQNTALLKGEKLTEIEGVHVYGVDLPGSFSSLRSALKSLYLNKEWSAETISEIKRTIYRYYQKEQHPFVVISVPKQDRESHVIQLLVEESKLGNVEVVGNQWTSSERIKGYFTTKPGQALSLSRLSRDVNFMNRDPFRFVNVIYKPGLKENTTDLTLDVHDRRPYRFYLGFDNSGVLATGRQRVFAGFSWDQVFGLDHVFFYQYTTNYNANRFHANTFQYMALLPYQAVLNLYGGFSRLHSNLSFPNRKNHGTNIQASLRYQMPLWPNRFFSHEIAVGGDVKNTNNTMEFVDVSPVFGQTVNLTQVTLGYQAKREHKRNVFEWGTEFFWSPGSWLPDQSNEDFSSLRPSAKHKWLYGTAFIKFQQFFLGNFFYELFARGQMSSQVLLPSEQLPLGGYGSIRGYDVRQFNADTGFFANIELHSPSCSLFFHKQPNKDRLHFLVFLDGGYGIDKVSVPGIKPHEYLIGAGPGIRYTLGPYLTARCDWGIKLHNQKAFSGGGSMVFFSVIGSY